MLPAVLAVKNASKMRCNFLITFYFIIISTSKTADNIVVSNFSNISRSFTG